MKELTDRLLPPLMEQLEKEIEESKENMAALADSFERIYTVFPDPIMKRDEGKPISPDVAKPDRLSKAIKDVGRLNDRMSRLVLKINTTLDTVIGSGNLVEEIRR